MVIREAVRYGEGYLYTEDEGLEDLETEREEIDGTDDLEAAEDMEEISVDYSDDEPGTEETDGQEFYAKWTDAYKEAREPKSIIMSTIFQNYFSSEIYKRMYRKINKKFRCRDN